MKNLYRVYFAVVLTGCLFAFAGCETESADEVTITITPNAAQLRNGESQTFTASGATGYRWNLSSTDYGVLSANTGERVTYTSVADVDTNVVLSVQGSLTSSGGGGGGTSTNATQTTTATTIEGLATITHMAEMTTGLNVSPRSATLAEDGAQEFHATGGSGSYEWTLETATLGWLNRTSGSMTTYTSTSTNATQFLTLTSGDETLKIPIYVAE